VAAPVLGILPGLALLLQARRLPRGHGPIAPDVEAAARKRFNPTAKPGDQGAIRPADDGVREDGD